MIRKTIALASLAALLGGCASGHATFNTRSQMDGIAPVKKLLVYLNVKSAAFDGGLRTSFIDTTKTKVESCGIAVSIVEYDPLELDMKKKAMETAAAFDPDASMFMVRDGGNLTNGSGGTYGQLYFDLKAYEKTSSKQIWAARTSYQTLIHNMYIDDKLSGARFGGELVAQMAKDNFIQGCPPDVVNPPK
jgi:hypothetical protein